MNKLISNLNRLVKIELPYRLDPLILVCIIVCSAAQLYLQFIQKINWDEFYYLSKIFSHQRGDLTAPLQTLHVHIFKWLTKVKGNELEQIEIGRVCMWLFQMGTVGLIYLTSKLFCSHRSSLLASLAYLCAGYVLIHGTSFRTDPMAGFFAMLCIYITASKNLSYKWLALLVISFVIAFFTTFKSVLILPLLLWLVVWQLPNFNNPRTLILRIALASIGAILLSLVVYKLHVSTMPDSTSKAATSMVSSSVQTTIFDAGFLPRLFFVVEGTKLALPQTIMFFLGIALAFYHSIFKPSLRANAIVLLGMMLPLASILFYRNAFPYFFPFIIPSSMCLVAYGASRIEKSAPLVLLVTLLLVGNFTFIFSKRLAENQDSQYQTLEFLHKAFPEPINYIDRCSMLGSSKKHGYFMSSWGHSDYRKNGASQLKNAVENSVIPVVIGNHGYLSHALRGMDAGQQGLFYNDMQYLHTNFIQHWGSVWVAAKQLIANSDGTYFKVGVPGTYTVESDYPTQINNIVLYPGDLITLDRSLNHISSETEQAIILRWGDHLYRPAQPTEKRLFRGF